MEAATEAVGIVHHTIAAGARDPMAAAQMSSAVTVVTAPTVATAAAAVDTEAEVCKTDPTAVTHHKRPQEEATPAAPNPQWLHNNPSNSRDHSIRRPCNSGFNTISSTRSLIRTRSMVDTVP